MRAKKVAKKLKNNKKRKIILIISHGMKRDSSEI